MHKVLLLGPSLSAVSGVSTHVSQLLSSTLAREFDLAHVRIGSEGRAGGHRYVWLSTIVRVMVEPVVLLAKIITFRPRILHINTSLVPRSVWRDMIYLVIGKMLGAKVVLQVHGGSLTFLDSYYKTTALFYRYVARLSDAVILVSSREARAHRALAIRNVLLIPNAIDISEYAPEGAKQYLQSPVRLVFLGRLHQDKGIFEAIEAVRILRERGIADFTFHIAGLGPAEVELRKRIVQYKLENQIALIGVVIGERKRRFWQDAGIFVLPSYHEGLPYAVLESMASATPVVASNVGAMPDAIEHGVHGLIVPPKNPAALADALAQLLLNRLLLDHMSQACLTRAAMEYRLERLIGQVGDTYRVLVGGRFRRPPDQSNSAKIRSYP